MKELRPGEGQKRIGHFHSSPTVKVFSFVNAQFRVCVFLTGFLGLGIKEKHELFRRGLSAVRLAVFYNFREKKLAFFGLLREDSDYNREDLSFGEISILSSQFQYV